MYTLLKEHAENVSKMAAEFTSELVKVPSPSLSEKKVSRLIENLGLFYGHDGWAEFTIGMDSPNPNFLQNAANAVFQNLFNESKINKIPGYPEIMYVNQPEFNNNYQDARIIFNRRLFADEDTKTLIQNMKTLTLHNIEERNALNFNIKHREEIQKLSNGETIQVRYLSNAWGKNPFSPLMDRARQARTSAGCKTKPGKWLLPRIGMGLPEVFYLKNLIYLQ